LEDVHHALVLQAFEDDAEGDEDTGSANAGAETTKRARWSNTALEKENPDNNIPAVNSDWSLLSKLLFGLVNLANKVGELSAQLRDSLFRPVRKLELSDRPRLTVTGVRHLELAQEVLRHVVLG
jgi:hypothetical protein